MKVRVFNAKAFKNLERLQLEQGVMNTEAEIYLITTKNKWQKQKELLKKLYIDEGDTFTNKLLTINTLIDENDSIEVEELVLPTSIAMVNGEISGFIMPYIENINLSVILSNKSVTYENKINFLKQIAHILEKMQTIRKDFFLGDIHESNFIVDKDRKVHVVDLDSCKIGHNKPFPAKFLSPMKGLYEIKDKYPVDKTGLQIPNKETEWFCYIMMLLNTIAQYPINNLNKEQYYTYLQFLRDGGFSYELLDNFASLYTARKNESPLGILEQMPTDLEKFNYNVLKYKMKKN